MPEYLHPGVYIEEIERGPKPIEGVPTSTAAFIGETERGPTKPRLVTSYKDYQRWFGGVFGDTKFMPYAVNGFFENGGKRLYVCRLTDDAANTRRGGVRRLHRSRRGRRQLGQARLREDRGQLDAETWAQQHAGACGASACASRITRSTPTGNPARLVQRPDQAAVPELRRDVSTTSTPTSSRRTTGRSASRTTRRSIELIRTGPPNTLPAKQFAPLATNGVDGVVPLDVADFQGNVQLPQRPTPQGLAALELDPYREVALVYAPGAPGGREQGSDHPLRESASIASRSSIPTSAVERDATSSRAARSPTPSTPRCTTRGSPSPIRRPARARKYLPAATCSASTPARTPSAACSRRRPTRSCAASSSCWSDINDGAQDVLNPRGVNAIRQFPERGIRVWGARTLTSDALWKYVSVRRLFIFLERSIYEGTQWVVFEPNDDRLWARVTDTIRLFLRTQWRDGALFGRTEEEAFFITCDRTTMTQDDILNGRLICEIGIAPVRPAEFVIFRIFQHTAEAQN